MSDAAKNTNGVDIESTDSPGWPARSRSVSALRDAVAADLEALSVRLDEKVDALSARDQLTMRAVDAITKRLDALEKRAPLLGPVPTPTEGDTMDEPASPARALVEKVKPQGAASDLVYAIADALPIAFQAQAGIAGLPFQSMGVREQAEFLAMARAALAVAADELLREPSDAEVDLMWRRWQNCVTFTPNEQRYGLREIVKLVLAGRKERAK